MSNSIKLNTCIHGLVEQRVSKTPDAVAVVGEGVQLSYRELNTRANQLARWLRARGAGPDGLIGLCMERSPEMIVAMLAILKSGSAYVPLDPAYPQERIAYILDNTKLSILITHSQLEMALPESQALLFCIDSDWEDLTCFDDSNLALRTDEQDLAYVIFTSGSTGNPKGVLIEHRSLKNYILEVIDRFDITASDRVLQFASLSFDTAAEEIYPILVQGGVLVLRTDEMLASPAQFFKTCEMWGITVLDLPTSYWHQLVASMVKRALDLSSIRLVIIGGERALRQSVVDWNRCLQAQNKKIYLWNTYGPTESTIVATMCELSNLVEESSEEVPIGKPIRNLQVYVLDPSLELVPNGESGELYIGGMGLARAYLNRPDLTQKAFIPDMFSNSPGARLYKTGDIVQYNQNGDLVYIGRVDDQVKLNGFRIELGEIESAMNSYPGVDNAVVCVKERSANASKLIAFIVSEQLSSSEANAQLREYLQKSLPHYMIPQLVTKLDILPLTINGKVDRKALLALELEPLEVDVISAPASTETEKCLEAIWQEVLECKENIGIHDDFFTLGGHSLLAIKVLARSNEEFNTTLSLRSFFEYPTIERMASFIDEMPTGSVGTAIGRIQPRSSTESPPLSYLQEEVWVYEQIEPGTTVHTVSQGFRIKGALDINVLDKSINEIIRRHDVLRTSYVMQGDDPIQIVSKSLVLEVLPIDLRDHAPADRRQLAMEMLQDEVNKPFTFPQGPLVRARLIALDNDEHILFFLVHHSVFDGWSLGLFLRELEMLYAAFLKGLPSPLPRVLIQYADYADWQRKMLQGDFLNEKLAYWHQKLGDGHPASLLPTDYPRKIRKGSRGGIEQLEISGNQLKSFAAVGRQFNASSFMVFLAAFMVLIYRYIGEKDVTIKSLVAGRSRPELESIIGYVANTLPFRAQIDPSVSFNRHLECVRDLCLDVYANEDIPYYLLAQLFNRHFSQAVAAAEIHFIHYQVKDRHLDLPGLKAEPFDIYATSSHGDLAVFVNESDDGALVIAEYNTDLFRPETVHRLLKLFEQIIKSIAIDPDTSIAQLRWLPDEELKQRQGWNLTQTNLPEICIHTLIERQVETNPEAIAAIYGDKSYSYRELQGRSNRVARYLQSLGVVPDVIVGICIEPSIEMLVGILGILKAGGAYLPIDPSHPRDRLALIIEDADVSIVLTQDSLKTLLPTENLHLMCLDSNWDVLTQSSDELVSNNSGPGNLAYVIYTSGSTGKPKGVMIHHAAAVNFIMSMVRRLEFSGQDNFLAITRLSFDISVLELLLPLTIGATSVIASRESVVDPDKLIEICQSASISVIQATPVSWRLLLTAGWQGPDVKALCGGEAMPTELARDLFNTAGRVWNMYGPTETTVWSTYYEITDSEAPVLIGQPIDNTQCYLLDAHMQAVPVGVTGELYIGGAGVTLGYLNRPELTARHFVPDPFSDIPNAKMFRTGDFARYHADGNIEHLGRNDGQVKIRGFRIELGEIEAAIGAHKGIRETVVLVSEQQAGNPRLIAYVIFEGDKTTTEQLRKELQTRLPDYMLPQQIMVLEHFPTTTSGKVDRKALPLPETTSNEGYLPPHTATEKYLAIVWEETLGLEADTVGLRDNFFALGGHSLVAIQVVARVSRGLKIDISLGHLFESTNLQNLAERIDDVRRSNRKDDTSESLIVPLQAGNHSRVPLFCICGIDLYRHLAHALSDEQPVYAIFIPGESDVFLNGGEHALKNFPSIEELASRYVEAMINYLPNGPMHLTGVSFGGILAYEIAQQLRKLGREVRVLALLDAFHSSCFTVRPVRWVLRGLYHGVRNMTFGLLERFKSLPSLAKDKQTLVADSDSPHHWGEGEIRLLRSEAYQTAMDKYEFKDYPNKTVVFRASESSGGVAYSMKPDYGWSLSVSGDLVFHDVPGDHLGILKEPSVRIISKSLDLHMLNAEEDADV